MSRSEVTETLYDAYGQRFSVDEIYFESRTEHQHLLIFHNAKFGRVMTLDGVVQTTERDEFFYHEMFAHVPLLAHGAAKRVLIIGGGDGGLLREFDALADRLRGIDGVKAITPIIEGHVMATANDVAGGALVRGLRPADIRTRTIIADNIRAGSLNDFKGRGHIVVGTRFARRFGTPR